MRTFFLNAFTKVLAVLTPVRVIAFMVVAFFFWFLALGDQGVYQLKTLLHMKSELIGKREAVNTSIDELIKERELLKQPDKLEMIIRKELGYIKPGEIIFEEKTASTK